MNEASQDDQASFDGARPDHSSPERPLHAGSSIRAVWGLVAAVLLTAGLFLLIRTASDILAVRDWARSTGGCNPACDFSSDALSPSAEASLDATRQRLLDSGLYHQARRIHVISVIVWDVAAALALASAALLWSYGARRGIARASIVGVLLVLSALVLLQYGFRDTISLATDLTD